MEAVNASSLGLEKVLSRLKGVKPKGGGEFEALCPSHNDIRPSLHIRRNANKLLLNCKAHCAVEDIVKAVGLEMSDLFIDGNKPNSSTTPHIEKIYPYCNADGSINREVLRYPPNSEHRFRQRRPDNTGGYIWNVKGIPNVLYHLPEILATVDNGETAHYTEGEKDADNLWKLGLPATTNPGGCGKWLPEYTETLRGANVVVFQDSDQVGRDHARVVANSLYGTAKSIKLLPPFEGFKDVSDWLENGGSLESLKKLMSECPYYEPGHIPSPEVDSETLSEPTVSSVADVYELLWKPEGIRMEATVKADNPTGFKAEIVIGDTINNRHLSRGLVNLLDSSKKASLAKLLNGKHELDWDTLLELAAEAIIKQYRLGEPYIDLATVDASSKRDFRLYSLLVEGVTNLFYGDQSSGKSYLMYLIALCIQNGIEILGFTPKKGKVLILDNETTRFVAKRRINAIKKGLGLPSLEEPLYHKFSILHSEIVQIQRMVMQKGIDLVIVDSVGKACGGDTTTQEIVTRYFSNLDKMGVTTLSLDHISKGEGKPTPYGSVYKQTTARMMWEVRGHSEGDNEFAIALYHRKDSDGRLQKAIGIKIEFEGDDTETDKATFSRVNLADIPELAQGLTQRDQIINVLKQGAKTKELISEETGISLKSVISVLNRYKSKPFIKVLDEWGIVVKDYE